MYPLLLTRPKSLLNINENISDIIIDRIGAKIFSSSIVITRVYMRDVGKRMQMRQKHMCTTHRVNAPYSQHMSCEDVLKHIV